MIWSSAKLLISAARDGRCEVILVQVPVAYTIPHYAASSTMAPMVQSLVGQLVMQHLFWNMRDRREGAQSAESGQAGNRRPDRA